MGSVGVSLELACIIVPLYHQIPGMPETISVQPIENIARHKESSSAEYAQEPKRTPSKQEKNGGKDGEGGITFRSGIHSIFPTGGSLNFASPKRESFPKYLFEPEATAASAASAPPGTGPRDHAENIAEEIAQKIARGMGSLPGVPESTTSSDFRAAALQSVTEHVEIRERRAEATRGPAGIDATRVPNLWMAVAHSSSIKAGEVKKVEVDGVPIALWRSTDGTLSAMSDVCIHRGASLARGWISVDRLVCPCECLR